MKIIFQKTVSPCVDSEVVLWHCAHGWVWNVWYINGGIPKMMGVVYCTLLSGDGVIWHFDTCCSPPWFVLYSALRKALAMISPKCRILLATVPEEKAKLIRVLCRMGFRIIPDAGFTRSGGEIVTVLKYSGGENATVLSTRK